MFKLIVIATWTALQPGRMWRPDQVPVNATNKLILFVENEFKVICIVKISKITSSK